MEKLEYLGRSLVSVIMILLFAGSIQAADLSESQEISKTKDGILLVKEVNQTLLPGEYLPIDTLFDLENIDGVRILKILVTTESGKRGILSLGDSPVKVFSLGNRVQKTGVDLDLVWGPQKDRLNLKPRGAAMRVKKITLLLDYGDGQASRKQAQFKQSTSKEGTRVIGDE